MSYKAVILDCKTLGHDIDLSPLSSVCNLTVYDHTNDIEVAQRISDCDVVILNKIKLNENNLKNAKNLKLICVTATGFDNIDTEYCKQKGISVCNVRGYSTNSVAQVTIATVLYLVNNIGIYREFVNSGAYEKSGIANMLKPPYFELMGKTWGIIGYGNIGKKVGEIANALGCNVIYTKNTPDDNSVSLKYLLKNSDIISIHTPLTEKTKNLINKDTISLMKEKVILVNEARGLVTNEEDVKNAVISGKIGAFGCDVYSLEPINKNHPYNEIKNLDNVCLTPHMAWGAVESRQRCIDEICENIKAFSVGEKRNRIV